jgi:uncharacterized protein
MFTDEQVIQQTINWVRDVVIGLQLCPFAAPVVKQQALRYVVDRNIEEADIISLFQDELKKLDEDDSIETTLMIFPETYLDFDDYLDLVSAAERLLKKKGYEGIYQVASFHPDYTFASSEENDAADYTNRSPYPMLHLLREESIDKALENFKDPDSIPERNVQFTREKGLAYMKMLRDACLKL